MKMKRRLMLLLPLLVALGFAQAQTKPEVLTNKNIIDLVKASFSGDVILQKISASTCKFDLSTTGLIDLKKQGISEEIISAMMDKTAGKTAAVRPESLPAKPVSAPKQPVISQLNFIHYYSKGIVLPLEKALGNAKSKRVAFGYGGNNLTVEIEGAASPVKLGTASADSFILNTGSSNLPEFTLYKLKVEKSKRVALVGKLTISGPKSGEGVIPVEISKASGRGNVCLEAKFQIRKGRVLLHQNA